MKWICLIFMMMGVAYPLIVTAKRADERLRKATQVMPKNRIGNGNLFPVIECQRKHVFGDYTAIYGYPNYLFRTDGRQKWTNEETMGNFCIWGMETEIHKFTREYRERQGMNQHMRDIFMELADGKSITKRSFYRRVGFFDLYFVDEDGDLVNVELAGDKQAMAMAVLWKMAQTKGVVPICAVGHVDERVSHIHFLYYVRPEFKNMPDMRGILTEWGKETFGHPVQRF